MLVQQDGHKVGRALEKIIEKGASEAVVAKAQAMLNLMSSYTHFNLAHNGVFLDLDDFQFLKDNE